MPRDDLHADAGEPVTRPDSLWPRTTEAAELPSITFAASRFDPLAEERARADAHAALAFDVCHPGLALRAVLLVEGVMLIGALVASPEQGVWWRLPAVAGFSGLAATLLWLVVVCALGPGLRRLRTAARAAAALALGAGSGLLGSLPMWWLELVPRPGLTQGLGVALAGAGMASLLWVWLDLRARIWQPVDARVRLAELQSRIRPHFLFNALNTALALVRVDPVNAEHVLEDLAQLFRVALADSGTDVSLEEEIALARAYLAIEQQRFGRRMNVTWQIDSAVHGARVPPLVLQPLVENAVRHGVEPSSGGAEIWVQARVRRGQAEVQVSNTVPDEPPMPGNGMAVHNVRERLRLLHDVAASLDCWREGRLHHARIVLPL